MELNVIIIIVSLVICALMNSYCCAFVHVERYVVLHEPLLVVPLYGRIAKMGLGVPAILFWIIPPIVASIITRNIIIGLSYFVLAQLLTPTGLITARRFKKRIVEPNLQSKELWREDRKDFYEWMMKHPAIIIDFSQKPLDPFLAYIESVYPNDLDQEIQI